jgi:hypothetical protein
VIWEVCWNSLLAFLCLIIIVYTLCRGANTDNWCRCCSSLSSLSNASSSLLTASTSSLGGDPRGHVPARFGYAISGRRKKALLWWFPFIFIEYFALSISVILRSYGVEAGQCIYDGSFAFYYL